MRTTLFRRSDRGEQTRVPETVIYHNNSISERNDSVQTLSDLERAYREIRRSIISCELAPNEQVTESKLASSIGSGRAAVRAALQRLHQERLVEVVPRHGYIVAPVTIRRTRELYDVRMLLEPEAVQLAAERIEPAEIARLANLGKANPYQIGDRESILSNFLPTNREFHLAIARASGNSVLVDVLADLLSEQERIFHISLMLADHIDGMYHDHYDLIPYLEAHDGPGAAALTRQQIIMSRDATISALALSPSLASVSVSPRSGKRP